MTFTEIAPLLIAFGAGGGYKAVEAIMLARKASDERKAAEAKALEEKRAPAQLPAPAPPRESDEELKAKFLHRAAVERIEAAVSEALGLLRAVAKDAEGAQKAAYKTATGFDNLVTQTAHVWDSTERALAEAKAAGGKIDVAVEAINEAVETLQAIEVAAKS